MIWALIAIVSTLTLILVLAPFLQREDRQISDGLGAFASQLEELERDRALEMISDDEARIAEAEIKRRWLSAAGQTETGGEASRSFRQAGIGLSVVSVMAAVLIYMQLGRSELIGLEPPEPVQVPAEVQEVLDEIDALAASLMTEPDNPEGWYVLGQAYMAMNRYGEAAIAFNNVIDRVPPNAALFSELGRAYVFAESGTITPTAREAFARAIELDDQDIMARFFLAEAALQAGDEARAIEEWQALAESLPSESRAREMVETRLQLLESETP